MATVNAVSVPFQKIAKLLLHNPQQLVPFLPYALRAQVDQQLKDKTPPGPPSLNLSVPGIPQILQLLPGAGAFFTDLEGILQDLARLDFPALLKNTFGLIPDTISFVGQQLGLGLSLLSILDEAAAGKDDITKAVNQGYQAYFFGDGYTTLEGATISPPGTSTANVTNPTLAQVVAELKQQFARKTGEQYARDLITIAVEASGDAVFDLVSRYKTMTDRKDAIGLQEQSWFKGFANLAESTVTSAVEEAAQGVSAFSTNAMIGASLGTFAGVAARKATQNAVLREWEPDPVAAKAS